VNFSLSYNNKGENYMKATEYVIDILGDFAEYNTLTANETLITNSKYIVDTSGAPVTLTLPSSPIANDQIVIFDQQGTFDTKPCTLTSSDNINSSNSDFILNLKNIKVVLIYVNASIGWKVSNLNSKYLKNYEIDDSNKTNDYILQYDEVLGKIVYKSFTESTPTPTLSGASSADELTTINITIDNYNSTYNYVITVNGGSYVRNGDQIAWTMPDIPGSQSAGNLNLQMTVKAEDTLNGYALSDPATHDCICVYVYVPPAADSALLIEGATFNTWGEDLNEISENDKFISDADNASVMSVPELQDTGDSNFAKQTPKIRVKPAKMSLVDGSSTVSSLVLDDIGYIETDSTVQLINSDNSIVSMADNITSITEDLSKKNIGDIGNKSVFNSGTTQYVSSVKLDNTHVMISYEDHGNSDYGTSIIGTVGYESTLTLTTPLSSVPTMLFSKPLPDFYTAIGTEDEYIPSKDITLTDLTNVSSTGLSGNSNIGSLWTSGGYHNKIGLTVNSNDIETDVLTVNETGTGPYTYTLTFADQGSAPTNAWKPTPFKTKLLPESTNYDDTSERIEVQYPLMNFKTIPNIRQLKYYMSFKKLGNSLKRLYSSLWK